VEGINVPRGGGAELEVVLVVEEGVQPGGMGGGWRVRGAVVRRGGVGLGDEAGEGVGNGYRVCATEAS
jgi:hypothetical protein